MTPQVWLLTLLRYSIGGPFVECKEPVDVRELAYCLVTQTCRIICPPAMMSTRLLPDVLRLSTEDITNLNCKEVYCYLAIAVDTIVDDL